VLEEHFELELPDGKVIVVDADGNIVDEKATTAPAETTPTPLPVGAKVNDDGATVTLPNGQVVANDTTLPAGATVSEEGVATLPTGETTSIEYVTPMQNGSTGNGGTQTTDDASTTDGNSSTNGGTAATGDTPQNNGETSGSADDNNEGSTPNTSGGTTPPTANGKPTVSDIKNKYAGSFASLESQATAKLNSLIGTAKSEYVQSQDSGEGVSYAYFYQKYYGAAMSLESNTDSAFNALLAVVKSELQQNGYDATYANSFVTEYEAAKKAREASILNQIK
ncbi:MAG: hypothetical protein UHX00_03255, partial [Caryophanon sp.]|nr:hypothetical protein [Caryophanon sp.]